MIVSFELEVLGGEGRHTGLDAGLLRDLDPQLLPYLSWIRVVVPAGVTTWRLDGQRAGGAVRGVWATWATSSTSQLITPPDPSGVVAEWQALHVYPGIPLADRCGAGWIGATTLRWIAGGGPPSYPATVIANIVQHPQLLS